MYGSAIRSTITSATSSPTNCCGRTRSPPSRGWAPMRDDALSVIVCGASMSHFVSGYLVRIRQETDLPLRALLTHSAERFLRPDAVGFFVDELYTSASVDL